MLCDILELQAKLGKIQPHLDVKKVANGIIIHGNFILYEQSESAKPCEAFAKFPVYIKVNKRYPNVEPKVYELNEYAANKKEELHINSDNSCCITIWSHWLCISVSGGHDISLFSYIDGPVYAYFCGRYIFENTGKWPNGEWEHGNDGLIDAYSELLAVPNSNFVIEKNPQAILKILYSLSKGSPKGHWLCPCGSGNMLRKCHEDEIWNLHEKISPWCAKMLYRQLKQYLPNGNLPHYQFIRKPAVPT